MNRKVVKSTKNLLGVFICTLFLGYMASKPANATLVGQNIEALTKGEWIPGPCTNAGGICFGNGMTHWGVSLES